MLVLAVLELEVVVRVGPWAPRVLGRLVKRLVLVVVVRHAHGLAAHRVGLALRVVVIKEEAVDGDLS